MRYFIIIVLVLNLIFISGCSEKKPTTYNLRVEKVIPPLKTVFSLIPTIDGKCIKQLDTLYEKYYTKTEINNFIETLLNNGFNRVINYSWISQAYDFTQAFEKDYIHLYLRAYPQEGDNCQFSFRIIIDKSDFNLMPDELTIKEGIEVLINNGLINNSSDYIVNHVYYPEVWDKTNAQVFSVCKKGD